MKNGVPHSNSIEILPPWSRNYRNQNTTSMPLGTARAATGSPGGWFSSSPFSISALSAAGRDLVRFLGGTEPVFDIIGAMGRGHMDLKSKRHLIITNWAVHKLSLSLKASPRRGACGERLTMSREFHKYGFKQVARMGASSHMCSVPLQKRSWHDSTTEMQRQRVAHW